MTDELDAVFKDIDKVVNDINGKDFISLEYLIRQRTDLEEIMKKQEVVAQNAIQGFLLSTSYNYFVSFLYFLGWIARVNQAKGEADESDPHERHEQKMKSLSKEMEEESNKIQVLEESKQYVFVACQCCSRVLSYFGFFYVYILLNLGI